MLRAFGGRGRRKGAHAVATPLAAMARGTGTAFAESPRAGRRQSDKKSSHPVANTMAPPERWRVAGTGAFPDQMVKMPSMICAAKAKARKTAKRRAMAGAWREASTEAIREPP